MATVSFYTLGCKVNQYETEAMLELFKNSGYTIVDFEERADIYIINTCTVTNEADKKSRKIFSKAKKNNSSAIVAAVGCYAQAAKEQLEENINLDLIIGNNKKTQIVKIIEDYIKEHNIQSYVKDMMLENDFENMEISFSGEKTRAHIKIQDGCNQFCSYCIIPFTRGRVRSRRPELVLKEIIKLVSNGYKEVVLTGIHMASYGVDLEQYRLVDLLEEINKIEGLSRIRLGSLEPTLITDEFANRIGKMEKLCPHFHLSLQSGCDETLKRMNRRYNTEEYINAVNRLRSNFSDPSITTDIIVGFPGETDEEFAETCSFVQKIEFADVHIFKYSMRKGTKAASMNNQVDENVKAQRSRELTEIRNTLCNRYMKGYLGKNMEVLFEDAIIQINNRNYIIGHTNNYLKICVLKQEDTVSNRIFNVITSGISNEYLEGNILKAEQ